MSDEREGALLKAAMAVMLVSLKASTCADRPEEGTHSWHRLRQGYRISTHGDLETFAMSSIRLETEVLSPCNVLSDS